MTRQLLLYILTFLTVNHAIGQTKYEDEVKNFFDYILADTYTYTFENYIDDSLKLSKTYTFDFEYDFLKKSIDTIASKYMLRTDNGKMHFDTVLIVSKPDNYHNENENQKLIKFLSRDSIFEIANPFNKLTIEKYVDTYTQQKKVKLSDLFNADFISEDELNQIFKNNGGWTEFHNKYGNGFIKMTIPIFTEDFEFAYFEWSYHCSGLCGYGYSGLYKKQNGKWTPLKVYMKWMS